MNEIDKLWTVSFCPQTNEFDIESVYGFTRGNFDMLFYKREECNTHDNWMLIYVGKTSTECNNFISAVKKQIKTGNTPVEDWYFKNFFDKSKN